MADNNGERPGGLSSQATEPEVSALRASIPDAENTGDWWAGTAEEYMNIGGPFASRDEAIKEGRHEQGGAPFYICRARLYEWRAPDAVSVMDMWVEDHDELWFEDCFPGFCGPNEKEREKAAEADLQSVLNAWFERHKAMCPEGNAFASHFAGEWIDLPAQGMETQRAKTAGLGPKDDSPVPQECATTPTNQDNNHD